jgi:hypothetical protein
MLIELSNNAWVDPEMVTAVVLTNCSVFIAGLKPNEELSVQFVDCTAAKEFYDDTARRINEYFERKNRTASVAGHMTQADHANNLTIADIMADLKAQPTPKEGELR